MGKKVFNSKARQNPQTVVDNSALKKIKLDLNISGNGYGYDEANALVLPSQKRQTKIVVENKQIVKVLSKKQRKHLQGIVDKKKKKEGRVDLLKALADVQIPDHELKKYTSISQVQTLGVKKLKTLDEVLGRKQEQQKIPTVSNRINIIKGAAKRKLLVEEEEDLAAKRTNPNILTLNDDESESESDDDNEGNEDSNNDDNDEENNAENVTKTKDSVIVENAASNVMPNNVETKSPIEPQLSVSKQVTKPDPPKPVVPIRPTVFVPVFRDPEVQTARLKLPILGEEQVIVETINENSIVIIAGETGSGKTTQIPQFLYESGYTQDNKLIGVTEPRRVAAIAMSKRVGYEMAKSPKEVSYLIRFEGNVTPETCIKFMTDGVLMKEIESDFMLLKYSAIVIDEAHERSSYTDILIGLLSRIVPLRLKRGNPLKLIIMSATLRVEDFTGNTRLFKNPPPVIKVDTRQFPVVVHFQKRTPTNYVEEAFRKTVKIHGQLPEGGILVFLTGQQEVNHLMRKLRRAFPYVKSKHRQSEKEIEINDDSEKSTTEDINKKDDDDDEFDMKRAIRHVKKSKKKFLAQISLPKINLDDYKLPGDDTEADLHDNVSEYGGSDEEVGEDEMDLSENLKATKQPLWVLPLYSLLSSEKQNRIFQSPPEGCRLCIVSTNVAETSLTIPNIKYVVDSGRQKTRLYDKITGVSAFVVTYTSKASADQRAGRAGRVSAGHCYRLYSSAVYNDEFPQFDMPDIQKKPVDDLMLQMRCMGIDRVVNFPFPSPPDTAQLESAERRLITLGALEELANNKSINEKLLTIVTTLGHVISRFPVAPRFGKMLALSHQQKLLPYTVCLVAALSVQEVLTEIPIGREANDASILDKKWHKRRQSWAATGQYQLLGDPIVLLRAIGAAEHAHSENNLSEFCAANGLRLKAVTEVRKLRVQLTNEINLSISDVNLCVDPGLRPPTEVQARFLRQILLAGLGDQVARKVPLEDINDKEERRRLKYAYNCANMVEPVFIHGNSVLKQKLPEWVVYQEAYETQSGAGTKMFIRGITAIDPEWLLLYVPLLCNIHTIRDDYLPKYNKKDGKIYCHVDATFGKCGWQLPLAEIQMPLGDKSCCYFAMFVMDGVVCPKLAEFKLKLKATPSSVTKSWSNLNEHLVRFKRAFQSKQIDSRSKLLAEWEKHPDFLMYEYQNILYDVAASELSTFWPPKTQ